MKQFKYLNIKNYKTYIEPEIKKYIIPRYSDQSNFFNKIDKEQLFVNCKNLKAWLNDIGLTCSIAAVIKILPNAITGVHKDQNKTIYAINFGILNYEKSPILLFDVVAGPVLKKTIPHTKISYDDYSFAELKLIEKIYLTEPIVWNTTIPHKIEHNVNNTRLTLSLRFEENISYFLDN